MSKIDEDVDKVFNAIWNEAIEAAAEAAETRESYDVLACGECGGQEVDPDSILKLKK